MDWQPIETAPRDGSDIILWLPWVACARTGRWTMHKLWSVDFGATRMIVRGEPTHWMPLPPAPAEQAPTGEAGG